MPDGGGFTDAPIGNRGIASKESEQLNKTDNDAVNAQRVSRSVSDVHDLRLTALLYDLVEVQGRVKAAETLGVSYGALARAADTGRLSGRMRDALARHLLDGGTEFDEEHRAGLAGLERRVAALEDGAGEKSGGEDPQIVELREALAVLSEAHERQGRRIAALEPRWPRPFAERSTPSRPAFELVVSLHPDDPGDDEKRFGAAAPLVADWRSLREEYGAAPDALAKLRAEVDLLEMEMLLVGGCGLTLPPADYPWDRFDLEDQTRRRKRRLGVTTAEVRRAERRRSLRRICRLGVCKD